MENRPVIRERPHRFPRTHYVGTHFVAFTLAMGDRDRAFVTPSVVDPCVDRLQRSVLAHRCAVPVYCFMPDHFHLMLHGLDHQADLWQAVVSFKQYTGYWFASRGFPFRWQKGFYDHILRSHEDWKKQVRYIANNPVRAGIVKVWDQYPFTGAIGYDLLAVLDHTL